MALEKGGVVLLQERLQQLGEEVPELLILPIYSQLPSDLQVCISVFLCERTSMFTGPVR